MVCRPGAAEGYQVAEQEVVESVELYKGGFAAEGTRWVYLSEVGLAVVPAESRMDSEVAAHTEKECVVVVLRCE